MDNGINTSSLDIFKIGPSHTIGPMKAAVALRLNFELRWNV